MSALKVVVLHLMLFSASVEIRGLKVALHDDNGILNAEQVIRTTTNKLFSILKIRRIKMREKLKDYVQMHNYFVSLMLRDHYTLQKIVNISKVDKEMFDNSTANFIDLINEILDVDSNTKSAEQNENSTVVVHITQDLVNYVDDYLQKLIRYQNISTAEGLHEDIKNKTEVLEVSDKERSNVTNITREFNIYDNDTDANTNGSDYWVPEEESGRRIFKGKSTKIKHYPFIVSVHMFEQFQCAGSIIDADLVITAASCLQLAYNNRIYRENPSGLTVRVGSDFYNGGGEIIPVMEIFFYPTYEPKTLRDNLAIMRITRRLHFVGTLKIKKIEIDRRENRMPSNSDGIMLVGWGARSTRNIFGGPQTNKITYSLLEIYPYEECEDIYTKKYVTIKHFCAGFLSRGGGACHRDVGAPGVVNGLLTGIVSFGSPVCGTPNAPTVFTKVGYYFNWIEEIMEKDVLVVRVRTTEKIEETLPTSWATQKFSEITVKPLFRQSTKSAPVEYYQYTDPPPKSHSNVPLRQYQQKIKNPTDEVIFQDFLKTMFDSNELHEFINVLDEDKVDKVKHVDMGSQLLPIQPQPRQVKKTDKMQPIDFGQVNDFVNLNYTFSSGEEAYDQEYGEQIPPLTYPQTTPKLKARYANKPKKTNDLETEVVQLLGNEEFQDIIKGSIVEAVREVQTKGNTTENTNKNDRFELMYKNEDKLYDQGNGNQQYDNNNDNEAWVEDPYEANDSDGTVDTPNANSKPRGKPGFPEFTDYMFRAAMEKGPENVMKYYPNDQTNDDPKVLISQKLLFEIIAEIASFQNENDNTMGQR